MRTQKYFPLDIKSAKSYGVKKWQEEFFWPVSYKSYMQMETKIKHALNELINENIDNELSELLLISYKLSFEYSTFLYSLRVLKEVNKVKLIPLSSDMSVNFKGIIENEIPLRRRLAVPSIPATGFLEKIKTKIKLTKAQLSLSKSFAALLKSSLPHTRLIVNYSTMNPLLHEYICNRLNGGITLKVTEDWYAMSNDLSLSKRQKDEICLLSKDVVRGIEKIAIEYGLKFTDLQYKYLFDITLEMLLSTAICLNLLNRYISTQKPLHLLAASGGNHFTRMLSIAVRGNGGTVTGFTHAEPVIHSWDLYSWVELSTVDKFITYTKHSARTMEAVRNIFPPLRANHVKIEGMETNIFYDQWRRELRKPIPKKIERVMIVAKGLENDNMIGQGIGMPELMQLDWERRIINILKKAGYKIIYKVHPRGVLSGQVRDLFDSDVQVIYEPFEEVMDLADAFLFYFTLTSTIGKALCTSKPIVYINGGWEPWVPQVYESFAASCRIVSSHFDDRNRLIINEDELLEALSRKSAEPNLDFVGKYMFPDGVVK